MMILFYSCFFFPLSSVLRCFIPLFIVFLRFIPPYCQYSTFSYLILSNLSFFYDDSLKFYYLFTFSCTEHCSRHSITLSFRTLRNIFQATALWYPTAMLKPQHYAIPQHFSSHSIMLSLTTLRNIFQATALFFLTAFLKPQHHAISQNPTSHRSPFSPFLSFSPSPQPILSLLYPWFHIYNITIFTTNKYCRNDY